jgi:hypothetical protein
MVLKLTVIQALAWTLSSISLVASLRRQTVYVSGSEHESASIDADSQRFRLAARVFALRARLAVLY